MLRQIQKHKTQKLKTIITFDIQRFAAIYDGTARADSVNNNADDIIIYAQSGADTVVASGADVTIDGGSGADKITAMGDGANVDGGSGADVIVMNGNDGIADGGSGNDKISLGTNASDNTISGDAGNDTIDVAGEGNIIILNGGKDVIRGYTDANSVSLTGDYIIETLTSGDSRISINGGVTATLQDYIGEVNIIGGRNVSPKPTIPSALKISNSVDNTVITGTAQADTVTNSGNGVTIQAGDGNNVITNDSIKIAGGKISHEAGQRTHIEAGNGNDTITNTAQNVTINADKGADYVNNCNESVFINLGSGTNKAVNQGGKTTIIGGNESDSIISRAGSGVSIDAGGGNNFIIAENGQSTVSAGNGADTIYAAENGNYVVGGGGNDNIFVGSFTASNTPFGTWTLARSSNSTIDAGADNDIINFANSNNIIILTPDSGYDTVIGGAGNSLSVAGSTKYLVEESGDNFIVSLEGGATATFKDTAENAVQIIGGTDITERALNVSISASNTLISGTPDNDSIISSGQNNTILGNDGDDTISAGAKSFVDGGEGDDSITASGGSSTISGGGGDNTIIVSGGKNLIVLHSDGNDLITGFGATDTLQFEDTELETLKSGVNLIITTDAGNEVTIAGALNQKILHVLLGDTPTVWGGTTGGKETPVDEPPEIEDPPITFSNGGKEVGTDSPFDDPPVTVPSGGEETISPLDVFQNFTFSLDNNTVTSAVVTRDDGTTVSAGEQILDDVISSTTIWADFEAAKKEFIDTLRRYLREDPVNGGIKFARIEAGINLDNDNEDVGAITGADAGNATKKNARDVVKETGFLDETFSGNSFTTSGLYVYLDKDFSKFSADEKYLWQGLHSLWIPSALELIEESFGANFSFGSKSSSTLTENKIRVVFYNEADGTLASVSPGYLNSRGEIVGPLQLNINRTYYASIVRGDPDGKSSAAGLHYLDRTLAHELTHAVVNANVPWGTGNSGLPCFLKEGALAELATGADDLRKSEIRALLRDPDSFAAVLDANKKYRVAGAYGGGYVFMRWLTWQASSLANSISESDLTLSDASVVIPAGVSVKGAVLTVKEQPENPIDLAEYSSSVTKVNATVLSGDVEIVGTARNESIRSGKGADQLYGGAGNDTLYGGSGDDTLFGGSGNDKLYGDAGTDTLEGGLGNDTLTGGAGADLFVYENGADVITDYTAGTDKIQVGESISSASLKGTDVVLNFDSGGSLTVKNGKNKKLTVIDAATGEETSQIYGLLNYSDDRTAVTLASSFTGILQAADYDSTIKKIDASAVTKAVQIIGNANANTIQGSAKADTIYGGNGADSISGAAGNDKLYGDAGADTLWGGAGNDTLTGGAGADLFVYTAGRDVITDYAAGDKIKIGAAIKKTSYSNNNVVFTIGSGTLTVQDAKGKAISITDASGKTSTKIYTTGVTYGFNGSRNSNALWFTEDDTNFIGETNLDAISSEKYSITDSDFDPTNYENFTATAQLSLSAYTPDK